MVAGVHRRIGGVAVPKLPDCRGTVFRHVTPAWIGLVRGDLQGKIRSAELGESAHQNHHSDDSTAHMAATVHLGLVHDVLEHITLTPVRNHSEIKRKQVGRHRVVAVEAFLSVEILGVEIPKNESGYVEIFKEFAIQMMEIKGNYEFIYNPPPLPSTLNTEENTIGNEYRKEFAEMYGGYVENVYLLSTIFRKLPNEILEMNVLDFLFWANYLNHKRWCEKIK